MDFRNFHVSLLNVHVLPMLPQPVRSFLKDSITGCWYIGRVSPLSREIEDVRDDCKPVGSGLLPYLRPEDLLPSVSRAG